MEDEWVMTEGGQRGQGNAGTVDLNTLKKEHFQEAVNNGSEGNNH